MQGPLRDQQLETYHREGYLTVDPFLTTGQTFQLPGWVDEISRWPKAEGRWMHHHEMTDSGPVLSRSENFIPYHAGIRQLLTEGPIIQAVSQLFGEPAVVFKEKINYKHPGGGGYAPHQDAPAYKYGSEHITCLVAVDDADENNGCLSFVPGRHREAFIGLNERGCIAEEVAARFAWAPAPVSQGGVLFFSSFIPHRSGPNTTDRPRRVLYVTYNKASEGDLREAYYADKRRVFAEYAAAGMERPRISTIGHFRGKGID